MKEEEKSIIYVARPGCSWCQKESPIVKSVGSEYDLKIYYLNTDPFWDSEAQTYTAEGQKFIDSDEHYKDGWGTPNTIIVGNGKVLDGEFSYVEKDKLKDLFKRNGFING
jgi:predicted bacteriocin transport accessory protein